MSTPITVVGRLTADPELRYTASGTPVASFTVAHNRRTFDRDKNAWADAGTDFYPCELWRAAAENAAESLRKGLEVVVTGDLAQRTFEARESGPRTVWEITVAHVGPSLRTATATVTKNAPTTGAGAGAGDPGQGRW